MDFQKLEFFVVLAETGKYVEAAEKLFVSQPTLSKHISALERELGVELLRKTKRGSELTQAGWEFYAYAKRALQDLHETTRKLEHLRDTAAGVIHVGSLPVREEYGIVDAFSAYWAKNPTVRIEYVEKNQDGLMDALDRHLVDVAFARLDFVDPSRHETLPVMRDELLLVCSTGHPRPRRGTVSVASLRNEDFIMLEGASGLTQLFVRACEAKGFFPHIVMSYPRHHAIFNPVRKGLGVTVLPRRSLVAYGADDLVGIPFDEPVISELGFIWPRGAHVDERTRDFMESVARDLGSRNPR